MSNFTQLAPPYPVTISYAVAGDRTVIVPPGVAVQSIFVASMIAGTVLYLHFGYGGNPNPVQPGQVINFPNAWRDGIYETHAIAAGVPTVTLTIGPGGMD